MSISKRISNLITEKKMSISAFEKKIGVGNAVVVSIIRRDSNVSGDVLSKILNIFPELDANWLITGKGNMYKNDGNVFEMSKEIEELRNDIKVLTKYIKVPNVVNMVAEDKTDYKKS